MFGSPETTTGGNALKFYVRARATCLTKRRPLSRQRHAGRGQPHAGEGRQEQDGGAFMQ
ncbi:MAG: hypothetical protein U0263_22075 [Polyangiaceae bacterium]